MSCSCGGDKATPELQELVGRVVFDLSSTNTNQVQVPKTARGLIVSWIPDQGGNIGGTSVRIYIGDTTPAATFAFMKPPVNAATVVTGPIPTATMDGSYLTIMRDDTTACKGYLLFEFMRLPSNRKYSTS